MENKFDLDIAFLGGLYPKETESEIYEKSKGAVQFAANALQWNIVEGLDKCNNLPVKIINSLFVGYYPQQFKDLYIKSYNFKHHKNAKDINVGFMNVAGCKHFMKYKTLKPHLKGWAMNNGVNKVAIAYALTYTAVKCLRYIKRINPNVVTCMVIPDLPEFMNLSEQVSILYRLTKGLEISFIKKNLSYVDKYVLLTEPMAESLNIDKGDYIVMEGISTEIANDLDLEINHTSEKSILYSGSLNKRYGVLDLVCAFLEIDKPDYRLILCGLGDLEEQIKEYAQKDRRILYKGLLKRDEVLKLQRKATLLVNPRQNIEEFTKYSFPSKVLEYLSSAKPVAAFKLDGIPDEYDDYIYYFNGNSPEDMAHRIVDVCEKSEEERTSFGQKARDFVLRNKNSAVQAKRILEMVSSEVFKINRS